MGVMAVRQTKNGWIWLTRRYWRRTCCRSRALSLRSRSPTLLKPNCFPVMEGWGASERETAELLLREPFAESGVLFRRDREPLSFFHLVMWRLSHIRRVTRGATISGYKGCKAVAEGQDWPTESDHPHFFIAVLACR